MTPRDLLPSIDTTGMTWLEAKEASEHAHRLAKNIRLHAANRPTGRGRRNRAVHAWWLAGAQWAAWLLDMHATAYRLHAAEIQRNAR